MSDEVRHSRHVVLHVEAERYRDPLAAPRRPTLVPAGSGGGGDGGGTTRRVGLLRRRDRDVAAQQTTRNRQHHHQLLQLPADFTECHLDACSAEHQTTKPNDDCVPPTFYITADCVDPPLSTNSQYRPAQSSSKCAAKTLSPTQHNSRLGWLPLANLSAPWLNSEQRPVGLLHAALISLRRRRSAYIPAVRERVWDPAAVAGQPG